MTTVVRNIERANHYAVQRLPVGIAVFDQEGTYSGKTDSSMSTSMWMPLWAPFLIRSCHRRKIILRPSGP